jgi:hypothetical protein
MSGETIDWTQIDWSKTRAEFDKLYSQAALARSLHTSRATMSDVLNGTYPYMGSVTAQKVLAMLDKLEVLVRKSADQEAA